MGGLFSRRRGEEVGPNPLIEQLQAELRAQEQRTRDMEESRQQAQEQLLRILEEQRSLREMHTNAAEEMRNAAEERMRTEAIQRQAEDAARAAEAARQRAEESNRLAEQQRLQAEAGRQAAEARMQQAEENARRVEQERIQADQARANAEDNARRADDDRRLADEQRRQAEEEMARADEARAIAEEQRRAAEEQRIRSEAERMRADEEARRARLQQEQAEQARAEADRMAAEAQAAFERAQQDLKEGIRPILTPTVEEFEETKRRVQYREGIFHFAVAGISGSGKSSIINAVRGMRNNDRGPLVARTGVTETTSDISRYPDPNTANPWVWYDIPGAGTLQIPDWVYFNAQGLYIFDCIIVLTDNRFTQTDEAIIRNCERFNIPTYIVRSKSRQHIQNVLNDLPLEDDEDEDDPQRLVRAREEYIRKTRESIAKNLDRAGLSSHRVYVVDKENLVQIAKGKRARDALEERELLDDLITEARNRRVRVVVR
ncbi:predicted protein [Postia placenta Mad-698-R]|uniref:IRG-type G domain-containing protein n=1 Tax=Postia placenta MAD-698-R-SB12 TaxID=670580 RepID=A0A1X6NAK8_9APHY|nr:hypothetical protein POSPLADRAFT_1134265 [Postia placenta MAD-698-R-SB12]EED78924.1 predicted protein [Postia placenta Mad-698-R]OSX65675.1 hypothetical protein POSPLADRAFT_1134265 [Postia placenta MAD-698-R-SB12]